MTGPLNGIKVLDFTWALAGPYGSMLLSDLGADVQKIEPLQQDERRRGMGPYVHDVSSYFFSVNRGKKSLLIDLKAEGAQEIILALIRDSDVLTENFSPGTMDRLGFGYEALKEVNPGLVYASTSGFGHTGPYKDRGAVDIIAQAMGGLISTTGHEGDPLPSKAGYSIGDMASGMFTAIGVLSALVERSTSGFGQRVDVAMLDSQVALMENPIIRHLATGEVQGPMGLRHPLNTPHQLFPTNDGWIAVAGVKDSNWQLFLGILGLDEYISDERFVRGPLRTENYAVLEPILFAAFRRNSARYWIEHLEEYFLVGPVNTIEDVVNDPQVKFRNMIVSLPTWTGGEIKVSNTPVKLSRTVGGAVRGASKPGEHTEELLKGVGFSAEQIDEFVSRGVVATGPMD
tara:strand:+ start:5364 stop:6566 length:1203 start_codon:yes stop_codon:yes gene_type:complete